MKTQLSKKLNKSSNLKEQYEEDKQIMSSREQR